MASAVSTATDPAAMGRAGASRGRLSRRVDMPLHTVHFKSCHVDIYEDDYMETVFPGGTGTRCSSSCVINEETKATAQQLGYGNNVRAMRRHHDLAHTYVAEAMGYPYSLCLHRVATGETWAYDEERDREERMALAFQRYYNTGEVDPVLAALPNLPELAKRFMALTEEIWPAWVQQQEGVG